MRQPDEDKVKKLPVWAKEYIAVLEREIHTASKVIAELQGERQKLYNGKVYIGGFTSHKIYLNENETITFLLGDNWQECIRVKLEHDYVYINGGKAIDVLPYSSNVIHIKMRD